MVLESFVAIMAMIAATLLDPGVYFAINSPAGLVGATARSGRADDLGWGFPVTVDQMHALAQEMGESDASSPAPAARRRSRSAWPASSRIGFGERPPRASGTTSRSCSRRCSS